MTRNHTRKLERALFRALVTLTYPLFLAAAVLATPFGGVAGSGSIFTRRSARRGDHRHRLRG